MLGDMAFSTCNRQKTKKGSYSFYLKGFATFWEFSFYGQKKVADYEYHSLFAEKNHFHT